MRHRPLLVGALVVAACNSILDNPEHHLVSATGGTEAGPICHVNEDCPDGELCLFQSCGRSCAGDRDCKSGTHCLRTENGTACVTDLAAACGAGCPIGTVCNLEDGTCRNDCDSGCLSGQSCRAGLCISGLARDAGAGGVGGDANDTNVGGAAAGSAAAGGDPNKSNPCIGVVCDQPPSSECQSSTQFVSYDDVGSCNDEGSCEYVEHVTSCDCDDDSCVTDPCESITCDAPPASKCSSLQTLTFYADEGTCTKTGSCRYAPTDENCDFGCSNASCKPDPCEAVSCKEPKPPTCKDATTTLTYAASGTCEAGKCSYAATEKPCDSNQACSGAGVCALCKSNASCGASCVACAAATPKCKDLGTTSKCVGCLTSADCSGATPICNSSTNACEARPSCINVAQMCGPKGDLDCCSSSLVTGGTFDRSNNANYPAKIGDFRLDTYEVTVSRFRKFVAAYSPTMIPAGAGKNPNNPQDGGWNTAWNASLPSDTISIRASLGCEKNRSTWNDTVGTVATESLPINCVDWFKALAFCIWDGGRLPTQAELNYAVAGGAAQRVYPWGDSPAPDCAHANFHGASGGTDYCVGPGTGAVSRVGSLSPAGDGLYGQADLSGNVWEWAQDYYDAFYQTPCNNCADLNGGSFRVMRGGSFTSENLYELSTSYRGPDQGRALSGSMGFRCARAP